jgi:hypothetical protein
MGTAFEGTVPRPAGSYCSLSIQSSERSGLILFFILKDKIKVTQLFRTVTYPKSVRVPVPSRNLSVVTVTVVFWIGT